MHIRQVFNHYQHQGVVAGAFKFCPWCGMEMIWKKSGPGPRRACKGCSFIQYRNPMPTVSILILDGERFLLGQRGSEPGIGTWSLPSGYIEYEHDFLTAAVREAQEETGLQVEITSILNVISSFVSPKFHFLGLYLSARVTGGELRPGDDLQSAEWFPLNGPLPQMGFQEDVEVIHMAAGGFRGLPVDRDFARPKA